MNEQSVAATIARAEAGDGTDLERHLRTDTLRNGWLHTVGVQGTNGEIWQVPGPPMDPEACGDYYRALGALEEIARQPSPRPRRVLQVLFDLAFLPLCRAYHLTRKVAAMHILDNRVALNVHEAALTGRAPLDSQRAEIERVKEAILWCMAHKKVANSPEAIARIVVEGIPGRGPRTAAR